MNEQVLKAALAGLLHDVGKLEQRARTDPWNPAPGVDREGQPVHATWTAYFAQQYLPKRFKPIGLHAAYHHAPDKSPAGDRWLSEVVALADKLSAGERSDIADQDKRFPQQLISIFDRIALDRQPRQEAWHYLPLKSLALSDDVIFPSDGLSKDAQGTAYGELCEVLRTEAGRDIADEATYLENLLGAMQRATLCVPSAYSHSIPDVSLYDHSRMTAALAVCLSDFDEGRVRDFVTAAQRDFADEAPPTDKTLLDQPVALLVGGDISGIQDFIYTLSSKGAAKTLRGRSFYLQLLTEAALRYVLQELGLPYANVIYSGGGHFYLLAPLSAGKRMPDIRQFVAQTLLQHHGTALYLALDYAEVPASGFRLGQFPTHWEEMHQKLGRAKQRRYLELGEGLYDAVFKPKEHGGNREKTCSVCGEERESVRVWDEERDSRICALCRSFYEDIGKALPQSKFVALGFGSPQSAPPGSALDVLRAFGMMVRFAKDGSAPIAFSEKPDRAVIWALDDTGQWPTTQGVQAAHIVRYTVNSIPFVKDAAEANAINQALSESEREDPARPDQPKTFTHLQAQAQGIKRLGVLRMDVDDLGRIFNRGFGEGEESRATLARVSTLSFQLSLFFEGWIKRLCEQHPNLIYAVYAGGDDVFLIGPWDRMPDLAQAIASDLARYASENPDIHISGSLAFIHGKYPVSQAADDASDAL